MNVCRATKSFSFAISESDYKDGADHSQREKPVILHKPFSESQRKRCTERPENGQSKVCMKVPEVTPHRM